MRCFYVGLPGLIRVGGPIGALYGFITSRQLEASKSCNYTVGPNLGR